MSTTSTAKNTSEPKANRTTNGRYSEGNPGGVGNPYAQRVAQLRHLILSTVSETVLVEILAKMIELAKAGNVQAAKFIFSYAVGKPVPAASPDHVERDEYKLFVDTVVNPKMYDKVEKGAPVAIVNELFEVFAHMNTMECNAAKPDPNDINAHRADAVIAAMDAAAKAPPPRPVSPPSPAAEPLPLMDRNLTSYTTDVPIVSRHQSVNSAADRQQSAEPRRHQTVISPRAQESAPRTVVSDQPASQAAAPPRSA